MRNADRSFDDDIVDVAILVELDPIAGDDRLAEGSIRPRATVMDAAEARLDCRVPDCSARN